VTLRHCSINIDRGPSGAQAPGRGAPLGRGAGIAAIRDVKLGRSAERPVKRVELDALLAAPEGFGDDVPVDLNFHARR